MIASLIAIGTNAPHAQSTAFEAPPVIDTDQLTVEQMTSGDLYLIAPEVQTVGFMAPISIETRYGAITASGPGMPDVRLNEICAVAALGATEANEQF